MFLFFFESPPDPEFHQSSPTDELPSMNGVNTTKLSMDSRPKTSSCPFIDFQAIEDAERDPDDD